MHEETSADRSALCPAQTAAVRRPDLPRRWLPNLLLPWRCARCAAAGVVAKSTSLTNGQSLPTLNDGEKLTVSFVLGGCSASWGGNLATGSRCHLGASISGKHRAAQAR